MAFKQLAQTGIDLKTKKKPVCEGVRDKTNIDFGV